MAVSYDGRRFRSVQNSANGEVDHETVFEYHQRGSIVWAEYQGGQVSRGHLIATADESGALDARYQHVNSAGALMTGVCRTLPEILPDGRYRLHEAWRWTCGAGSSGESVVEEFF